MEESAESAALDDLREAAEISSPYLSHKVNRPCPQRSDVTHDKQPLPPHSLQLPPAILT